MKRVWKKIVKNVGLLFVLGVFLVSCGKVHAISANDFATKMKEEGFKITEDVSTMRYDDVEEILLASNPHFEVEYYKLTSNKTAETFFDNNKGILVANYENTSMKSSYSGIGNTQKFSVLSSTEYVYFSRINSTCILIMTQSQYQEEVDSIVKKIGY